MSKKTIKINLQLYESKVKEKDTVIFENTGNVTVDIAVPNADQLFDGVNSGDLKLRIDQDKSSQEYTVKENKSGQKESGQKEFEYTVTTTTSPKIIVQ